MLSLGPAMLMASMNSSEVALANAFKSASEQFSADGRPGAFEQPHASHHVAHDSDDLGVVETVLAGSHIWRVIRGKRMLVSLDVDESPSDMLEA